MADKFAFELDAGIVMAKLHLGGCQTHKEMKFFNTGILNDQKMNPEQVTAKSKITFDFDNRSGLYELGVVPEAEHKTKLEHTPGEVADEMKEADEKAEEKAGEESKATDSPEDVEKKEEKNKEAGKAETDKIKQENKSALDEDIAKMKENAVIYLKDYMTVFAGKEQAAKITEKDVKMTYLPEKESDPYSVKYKNWTIPEMTAEEVQKSFDEQVKNEKTKEISLKNVCFKIMYQFSIKVEK